MRAALVIVLFAVLTATACRRDALSPTPHAGSGLKLDIRIRQRCMKELAAYAEEHVPRDMILEQIPPYSVQIQSLTDANGMCQDHWGLNEQRARECVDRLAILVGLKPSGTGTNPCVSGGAL